jgi:RNA polymerase sigma factor (sigma-70 family)
VARPDDLPPTDAETDDRLMVGVRQGRVSLLGVLFERHHRALFNFFVRLTGNRQTSDDLVQEVFLRMLRYRVSYRPHSQFPTWMYRIARNVHIDRFKSERGEVGLADVAVEPSDPSEHVVDVLERASEAAFVRRALLRLPVDKREVLVLSRFHGLSYAEVGDVLGCEAGAVKVRVFRAMQQLRRIVAEPDVLNGPMSNEHSGVSEPFKTSRPAERGKTNR